MYYNGLCQILDEERPWLQRARKEVESQAKKMLLQGLEHLVQIHVQTM